MKISIITATWNCAATVGDCLRSVAAQSHAQREHLVVDGASTDGTLAILEAHRAQLAVLLSEPDGGIYDALNKGIARATGEVIGFLHADDLFADTEVLARIAAAFAEPQVQAVYGDLVYVRADATQKVVRYWRAGAYAPARLARGWMPPHPTLYVRRRVYAEHGGFDTAYRIAADYDCMLRLLTRLQGRVAYLPQVLVRMRLGGTSNRSLKNILRKSAEDYRALRSNHVGGLGTLAWKNLSKLPQFLKKPPIPATPTPTPAIATTTATTTAVTPTAASPIPVGAGLAREQPLAQQRKMEAHSTVSGGPVSTTQQLSIMLSTEMAEAIQAKVASGAYTSASEVIREGLRALMERDRIVENWLREEAASSFDALRADPTRAITHEEARARLAAEYKTKTT